MVTPVVPSEVPTAEVLQGLFDLTPAEARVARGIGEGRTIETIAMAFGTSRETVTRVLGDLRKKELITLKGSTLVIRNRSGLEDLVS